MQAWRIGLGVAAYVMGMATVGLAYQSIEVVNGGSISGEVKYQGDPPAPVRIAITKDPEVCGREKEAPSLVVGSNKGIQNVVVRVVGIKRGKKLADPVEVTFDQKGCEYRPHVLLFPMGSTILMLNTDDILHNTNVVAESNPAFSVAQPQFRRVVKKKIEHAEMPIRVRCDVHAWMGAWWVSQEHPYYALTDASGAYTLDEVPPGDHTVEVWHETLGKVTRRVTVTPHGVVKLDLEMGKP